MLQSMTGFASAKGESEGYSWTWELRSVNAKGLDLRLRVPDWIEGLEPQLRSSLSKALSRGSVSLGLRVQRTEESSSLSLDQKTLETVLDALVEVESQAMDRGLSLAPANPAAILDLRGVLEAGGGDQNTAALGKVLMAQFPDLIKSFKDMRLSEGASLEEVMKDQLSTIQELVVQANAIAKQRKDEMAQTFKDNLARVLENADGLDETRVAQELAVLAVKSDVTEEIDRLNAHVHAAHDLIAKGSPVGRKLDFLMQEFNREANTLCSKAQNVELTRVGLELKVVIDQMREQVQNVE